jgi:lysophospholipase L1-like esterase
MAYTNVLSRALNAEFINLGFSGSGRGEQEVIEVVAGVQEPRLFVLDYEANSGGHESFSRSLPQAVDMLRQRHPTVPILIVSRIPYARDVSHRDQAEERDRNREMQARLVEKQRREGDANIHFYDGADLLGPDFHECTVDGVHPNDLGFMRMARHLEPTLRRILNLL